MSRTGPPCLPIVAAAVAGIILSSLGRTPCVLILTAGALYVSGQDPMGIAASVVSLAEKMGPSRRRQNLRRTRSDNAPSSTFEVLAWATATYPGTDRALT